MKLSPTEQEQLIALLTRICLDIAAIEEEFSLLAGNGDFRPRIEYFHDAVRALSSREPQHVEAGGRLSVELLAYDVSCLRYIQSMPLAPFRQEGLSPQTQIITGGQGLVVSPKRPGRAVRDRLSELYQHYAVLFAALLKPAADADYHARVDNLNQDVQDISNAAQALEAFAKGKAGIEGVTASAHHVEDNNLRQLLAMFVQQQKYRKKENIQAVLQAMKLESKRKDKQISAIDKAHLNFAMSQLGIYESSKDLLKKMAGQGMNLVGKFVEASVSETRRDMGR